MLWAATIIPFSELPFLLGLTTATYAVGALVLGMAQAAIALMFAIRRTDRERAAAVLRVDHVPAAALAAHGFARR